MDWDNGRTLMLSVPPDQFEVLPGARGVGVPMAFPTWACPHGPVSPVSRLRASWGRLAGASRRGHRARPALVPRPAGVSLGLQKIRGPRTNRVMATAIMQTSAKGEAEHASTDLPSHASIRRSGRHV